MRLIIPAAGAGIRLVGSPDNPFPKLLIPLHGRPLISHLLRIASSLDLSDVVLVLGPNFERVTETLRELCATIRWSSKTTVTCIRNPRYLGTNSIYSVWLAREFLEGDVIIQDGDTLTTPSSYRSLTANLNENEGLALIDPSRPVPMEETKVRMKERRIVEFAEHITPDKAEGRYIGAIRFAPSASDMFREEVDSLIRSGDVNVYYTKAVGNLTVSMTLKPVWAEKSSWLEIDTWDDLKAAGQTARQIIDEIEVDNNGDVAEFVVRD